MPVTIKDIAAELGLSVSTVSKALNDYPDVSPATRQKEVLLCNVSSTLVV